MKDPAFLFYSNDFYSGTRTMLPEERACYIDLLIYQHQNGFIPSDLKRVLLFCSGVAEATLEATLEAKFERTPEGWVNRKLESVVNERKVYKNHQSLNGIIGAFWKKAMKNLKKSDYKKIRQISDNQYSKKDFLDFIIKHEKDPSRVALAMLKHLEDEIEIEIENKDEIKDDKKIRENEFREKAKEFESEFGQKMISEFCDYWTESNPSGRKLKFEMQKTFDISRRLKTWSKNNFNGTSKNTTNREVTASQDNPGARALKRLERSKRATGA